VLKKEHVDALIIRKSENIFYLSGFEGHGSALLILADSEKNYLLTTPIYAKYAEDRFPDFEKRVVKDSRDSSLKNIAKREKLKRIAFESCGITHKEASELEKRSKGIKLIPKEETVESLRAVKDADEIKLIKHSIAITKSAFSQVCERIRPGLTCQKIAVLVDNLIRSKGGERTAFRTIAAIDPHSSHPHAVLTNEKLKKGSTLLIDMGAVYKGYNSDLTRVFFLGRITSKYHHIYNVLLKAQEKAIKKARPGAKISDIDKAARRFIEAKGYGKYFIHSLGHGVGLNIHEYPRISSKGKGRLRPGMVFTVEPGIYIPGWGGLRVEDMLLITNKGCEVLTHDIPK